MATLDDLFPKTRKKKKAHTKHRIDDLVRGGVTKDPNQREKEASYKLTSMLKSMISAGIRTGNDPKLFQGVVAFRHRIPKTNRMRTVIACSGGRDHLRNHLINLIMMLDDPNQHIEVYGDIQQDWDSVHNLPDFQFRRNIDSDNLARYPVIEGYDRAEYLAGAVDRIVPQEAATELVIMPNTINTDPSMTRKDANFLFAELE
jgi:hypothetical protein